MAEHEEVQVQGHRVRMPAGEQQVRLEDGDYVKAGEQWLFLTREAPSKHSHPFDVSNEWGWDDG